MKESRESTLSQINLNDSKQINTQKSKELDKSDQSNLVLNEQLLDTAMIATKGKKNKKNKKSSQKKSKKEVRENITNKMPKFMDELGQEEQIRDEDINVELADIEKVLDIAAADTGRAALYYKVRDAIKLYRAEQNPDNKTNMLLAVRESAYNYLLEKRGNAPARKKVCADIISKIDSYAASKNISTERNLDYLVDDVRISDKKLDMEIMLAGKLTVKGNETFDGNLKDRRSAFKRKIKDVRLARALKDEMNRDNDEAMGHITSVKNTYLVKSNDRSEGYDDAVARIVAAYMNMPSADIKLAGPAPLVESDEEFRKRLGTNMIIGLSTSDNDTKEHLITKGHMIETILSDVMTWNPSDFEFKEPGDFLNRTAPGTKKEFYIKNLFNKLQIAEAAGELVNELTALSNANKIHTTLDVNLVKEAKARISMYKEIGKEYRDRFNMMNSPYYALLLQEDTNPYNTEEKLKTLTNEKKAEGTNAGKSVGRTFKNFIKNLVSKNKRLVSGRRNGGEFTRKTDTKKLLKWHRRQNQAEEKTTGKFIASIKERIEKKMAADNANLALDEKWFVLRNAAQDQDQNKEDEEEYINININEPEHIDAKEENVPEENVPEEIVQEKKEEPDPAVLEAQRKALQNDVKNKQAAMKDGVAKKAADIDKEMDEKRTERIKKQLEEDKKQAFRDAVSQKQSEVSKNAAKRAGELDAEIEAARTNLIAAQLKKEKLQKEISEKQSEVSRNAAKRAAEVDAEIEAARNEVIKTQLKKDKMQKEIAGKQSEMSAKSSEWLKKFEEKQSAEADERIRTAYLLEAFDKLATDDVSMEDAFALRRKMAETVKAFSGAEDKYIEFVPTEKLAEFTKYVLENKYSKGAPEKLAKMLKDLDDSYTKIEDDSPLLERVSKLMEKGDKMTAQDKLLAYDYNVLLVCMNRSMEDGDIKYNDYKSLDLKALQKYATQTSVLRATDASEDTDYDELPEEQARAHEAICRTILSEYTGKDEDYFRVLPLGDLSGYAFDVHDIVNKQKAKEAADECLKLAEEIHGRIKSIDVALNKNDRAGIIDTIEKLSGLKPEELRGYATMELKDVLISMYANTNAPEELAKQTAELVSVNAKLFNADYYKARLEDNHRRVWLKRDLGDEASFEDLRGMAEYSILYLKQHEGLTDLSIEDYTGLSADEIYYIYRNVGIIDGLKGTTDPYEQDDVTKAIRELAGIAMSDKLKNALEKTLDVNFNELPEYVNTPKSPVYMVNEKQYAWKKTDWQTKEDAKKALKDKSITEREKHVETEEHKKFMLMNESYHRQLDKLAWAKKKKIAAKVESEDERKFSEPAVKLLSILGDITDLTGAAELDSALPEKIQSVLADRAEDLVVLLGQDTDKGLAINNVFTELKTGCTAGEKKFIDACENSLMPVINALSDAVTKSNAGKVTKASVSKTIKSGVLKSTLKGYASSLETNLKMFENEMLPLMTNATADIYGRGEDTWSLPEVTELMSDDMKALINLIEEETKKDKIAAAKNTKERLEAQKKSQDQAEKERGILNEMQDNLLYDSKKGQGRFNQLLISGYYKNASRADRRRMLSHVIRDLKKTGANVTAKEKGCEYFASTMKGAGPLMQKMMQGVPERMVIPELVGALSVVKSSLAHIDPKYVDKVFKEMIKDSKGAITSITERESLGAASVAETFKCKIEGPKIEPQYVVVKILRPDAEANMKKDLDFVRMSAMFADMSDRQKALYEKKNGNKLVNHEVKVTESGFLAQFSEIEKEFDFTKEAANAKLGYDNYVAKYNKKKDKSDDYHVKSVQINENFAPKKHYLVMDMASGVTVDKIIAQAKNDYKVALKTFRNTDSSIREPMVINSANIGKYWELRTNLMKSADNSVISQKLCADLAYVWLEQALFGSKAVGLSDDPNFHHGDMHAGNIMVDGKHTTILDYGNSVILLDSKVNQILSMLSAVVINSSKHFVEAFNNLLKLSAEDEKESTTKVGYAQLTEQQKAQFIAKLDELFKLGTAEDTGKKILVALNVAQSLGVKLPKEIQNFSQCQQRLENTLQEVKDGAVKTTRMVDTMAQLPIAPEDQDSIDPFIKLHKFLYDPENRSKEKIQEFSERYSFRDSGVFMNMASKAATKEELDGLMDEYVPLYSKLKARLSAKEARAKAAEIRQTFNEAVEISKTGKPVPRDKMGKLQLYVSYLLELSDATGCFGGFMNDVSFIDMAVMALNPSDEKSFDVEAFEKLAVITEKLVPELLESGESMYELLADVSKDLDKERARRVKVSDLAYDAEILSSLCKPETMELSKRLRESKDGELREKFERQAATILTDRDTKNYYDRYRKAEAEYDKIKDSDDKEAVNKARKQLKDAENMFLYSYMTTSCNKISNIANKFESNYDKEQIDSKDYMPDFVSVMGDVVSTHWKRSAAKVNKSLGKEIKRISDEQEKLQKQIKNEEEAEAKKLKEEQESKRKEEEAEIKRKKKEEAKRAKEAEALRKKKEAEEAKKKKEAEKLAKKKKGKK